MSEVGNVVATWDGDGHLRAEDIPLCGSTGEPQGVTPSGICWECLDEMMRQAGYEPFDREKAEAGGYEG